MWLVKDGFDILGSRARMTSSRMQPLFLFDCSPFSWTEQDSVKLSALWSGSKASGVYVALFRFTVISQISVELLFYPLFPLLVLCSFHVWGFYCSRHQLFQNIVTKYMWQLLNFCHLWECDSTKCRALT